MIGARRYQVEDEETQGAQLSVVEGGRAGHERYERSPVHGVSRTTYLIGISSFCNDLINGMVQPLMPIFLTTTLGVSGFVVGLIDGVAEGLATVLRLPAGLMSDRSGRRRPYVVGGYALSVTSKAALAIAGSWWHVFMIQTGDRLGQAVRSPARDAMIADAAPKRYLGRNYGFFVAVEEIGSVLGPLIATAFLLLTHDNLRLLFAAAIVPSLLLMPVLLRLRDRPVANRELPQLSWRDIGRFPRRYYVFLAIVFCFFVANSSDAFLMLRLRDVGFPIAFVPLAYSLTMLTNAALAYPAGVAADRIGPVTLVALGYGAYGATYLGFAYLDALGRAAVWPLLLLYGAMGLSGPGVKKIAAGLVPAERRATAFGLLVTCAGTATLLGNLLSGTLWTLVAHRVALGACGALALAAAVGVVLYRDRLVGE